MANHFDRAQWLGASMLAIVAAAGAAPAMAQDSAPQAESAPQDDPASTIVVTGFRAALENAVNVKKNAQTIVCLLYTSPSPRDRQKSRMPSSA